MINNDLVIVDSNPNHIRDLVRNLREKDKKEATALGYKPYVAVIETYRKAFFKKTALIGDNVVAIWGVIGSPITAIGYPYLITSNYIYKISPLKFIRLYKQEVEEMKKYYSTLENYVDASYEEAIKALKLAGFTLTDRIDFNDHNFIKFSLRV